MYALCKCDICIWLVYWMQLQTQNIQTTEQILITIHFELLMLQKQ